MANQTKTEATSSLAKFFVKESPLATKILLQAFLFVVKDTPWFQILSTFINYLNVNTWPVSTLHNYAHMICLPDCLKKYAVYSWQSTLTEESSAASSS